jgi:hypothetical protein
MDRKLITEDGHPLKFMISVLECLFNNLLEKMLIKIILIETRPRGLEE